MKTLTFALLALSLASLNVFADTTLSASTMTLKENEKVSFKRAEINMEEQQGVLVKTATTYYSPKVWINGRLEQFFVGSTNGNQFCEERGHNQEISGSTITCGEDESAYGDFDWYNQSWGMKSTGSKNQCYQLYATIKCQ
ncbi:hypothetical protein H5119_17625 [Pseudoalteromonas sp. SG45-5]|uniref:hypothetical protein n=1 Tax=unclassified Pseudoalteromonas TaxID=194690 RepID=UPI0015F7CFD1|nr:MULTISPECIES: hypothetical protein [unclassified Pseudoalteromonas]MBB1387329.1 hypothetical protein [Pseudoalteromonas sp. SG45-5]MBB1394408.1 hypothetical protein [Pseudoalteromonas sp. SG44-4]MBB1449176.1 hypothetical protein [Pseudoalteromonas sp. SG41-6]